jgi:proteasome component ECM29
MGSSTSGSREASKSRAAVFQYINFVARHGSVDTLHAIAPRIIQHLKDYVENQGWPRAGPNEDTTTRGYAYEVIGLLGKAGERSILVENDHPSFELLRWLFESLGKDSSGSSITVSIEEALSTIISALAGQVLSEEEQHVLEDLLTEQMERSADLEGNKRLRSTRYVALRFANRCLPFSSYKARWINVLGMGATSDRAEVREEGERGLSPYWYMMLNGSLGNSQTKQISYPRFTDIVYHFFQSHITNRNKKAMALANDARKLYPACFEHMTAFARRILFHEAMAEHGLPPNVDNEWERRVDSAAETDEKARSAIRKHIAKVSDDNGNAVAILLSALFASVTSSAGGGVGNSASLVELIALSPDNAAESLLASTGNLLAVLKSNDHARRLAAARAYGILATHPSSDTSQVQEQVSGLHATSDTWERATGATANQVHGSIVGLGFYYARSAYRSQAVVHDKAFEDLLKVLAKILVTSRDATLLEAVHVALGQICLFQAVTVDMLKRTASVRDLADQVYLTAKSGNEPAILTLGHLSLIIPEKGETDDNDLLYLEEQLHKLHEIRQPETHFAVGEAFSCLALGWQSIALATKQDINGPKPRGAERDKSLGRLLDRTLSDCGNTKPTLRKASVMWLLCLVQFCGHRGDFQARLPKCQAAFKRCLGDRDELVQEAASRGLGLIYEKGDKTLKDDLVRDLISSFSSDRQSQLAGNVSADTQLFEPGALPTGEGGSVSTYKDIMSLASEVGDSSLVYKFMSMASSNAIWSSRAAFGRFGLSNVLSDSSVDGYLADNPKLYPKLYRYRFDPSSGVQRSMNDIWNSLVKDSTATVDKYFDDIMEDLLTSVLGKEWRTRQASCAAMADLVQGRPLERYGMYLERIWTHCFKVLDDIKESVRAAAASLARVLTGVLTRALETDHSADKNATTMLKHVLPFLLSTSGMESSAEEVRAFSVHTLLEIIKKANGVTLRPSIPDLVERLIGSMSTLEPEAVNYLHLNASKYNLTEQKIDDMRLSSVRSSPLMEAIERCLDLLDSDTMQALQPRLEEAMKTAVGLPSKVGASRVLVSLATRRFAVFRPHADHFLKLLGRVVLDRNDTVSSSYAIAAGYLARAASDQQLLRLLEFSKRLYFESESDRQATTPRRSITSGEITFAVAKHATDRFNSVAASIMPFVFVAKHDPNEQVKEQFQNTWNEIVGGTRAVALYLTEILDLCSKHLDSPQWALKHTSARAVADAVSAVASLDSNSMNVTTAKAVWPVLEKAIAGKTWDGKEVVLKAFTAFVKAASQYYKEETEVAAAILKVWARVLDAKTI